MPIQNSSSLKIQMPEGPVHILFLLSSLKFMYLFKGKHLSYTDTIYYSTYTLNILNNMAFQHNDTCISPSCCSIYMLYQLI